MTLKDPSLRLVQRLGETAQFRLKTDPTAANFAQMSLEQDLARGHILPIDQPGRHLCPVIKPSVYVCLADPRIAQNPQRLAVVHRQPRALRQRPGGHARFRQEAQAIKDQWQVMVGKSQLQPVKARNAPSARHGGGPGLQMQIKRRNTHTRTSTTGALGTSPALKLATEVTI